MQTVVIGGGELGTAVALSLLGQQHLVTMALRDENTVAELRSATSSSTPQQPWPVRSLASANLVVPKVPHLSATALKQLPEMLNKAAGATGRAAKAVCVCVPSTQIGSVCDALRPAEDAIKQTPLLVFTRGFCDEEAALPEAVVRSKLPGCSPIVVSGPLSARSWAMDSTKAFFGETPTNQSVRDSHLAELRRVVSPTLLHFGASDAVSLGARDATSRLFRREGTAWLPPLPEAWGTPRQTESETLGLVNALLPAIAFGGGMLSSTSGTDSVAAAAYFHHALSATDALLSDLIWGPASGARRGTAVTAEISASIMGAIANATAVEFVYGRKQDFFFTQNGAMSATFSKTSDAKDQLKCTFNGIHHLLKRRASTPHPFFRALVEGFNAVHRPQMLTLNIVKNGNYEWLDAELPKSELFQAVEKIDRIIESDGEGLEEAARNLARTIGGTSLKASRGGRRPFERAE